MKKNVVIKKYAIILSIIAFFAMFLLCSVVYAAPKGVALAEQDYTPVVTVEQKRAYRGQTFEIDVDLSGNEGLLDLYLTLEYDTSVMVLTNVERTEALGSLTFTNTNTQTNSGFRISPFNMLWDGRKADATNGTIVRLTFESFADAPIGTYPIRLTYDPQNTNKAYKVPIAVQIVNGSVTLIEGDFEAVYYDWDGKELFRKFYRTGQKPSYEGATPVRADDKYYSYAFSDWQGIVSEEDSTLKYQANYLLTPKRYQVFYYADGVNADSFDGIVSKDDYWKAYESDYGAFLQNEYPTKARYVFSGWFSDEECLHPFVENLMPAENISLYGYFVYDIRTTSIPKIQLSSAVIENTVVVYANMVLNTGFNGMVLTLDYDSSVLEFAGYNREETFETLQFDTTNTDNGYDTDGFKFYFEHSENSYETGVFLKMTFDIKDKVNAGIYDITFTLDNTDATYINGTNGIRYTEIEIIGTQVPIGKIYKWEKSTEDTAEITVESESGMPADTTLRVSVVPTNEQTIDEKSAEELSKADLEIKAMYDLKLLRILGGSVSEIDPDGLLTVEIKLTQEQQALEDLFLYYVGNDGKMIAYNYERIGDVLRFQTDRLDQWAIVGEKPRASGKLSDAAVLLITMPILLAIVTLGYAFIVIGKYKKKKEKNDQ